MEESEQKCWISDIQFIESGPQGVSSFVLYTIRTEFPSGQSGTCISDFEWLQKSLENEFKGVLVPQIPEKDALFRFTPEVVQYRRRQFGKFLQRLVTHPQLSQSKSLDVFLTATRDEFNATKEAPVAEKAGESGSFFTSVVKNVTSIATNLTTEVQEIDRQFTDKMIYIETLQEKLEVLADAVETKNGLKVDFVENMVEFAKASENLGKHEKKKAQRLAEGFTKLGETIIATATLEQAMIKSESEMFEDTLKDQARLAASAMRLLENRQAALKQYQIAQHNTKTRQDKSAGTDTEALELAKAQEHEEELRKKFEELTQQVKDQLAEYKVSKAKDVRAALRDLALKNIECCEQSIEAWKELAHALEAQGEELK